MVVVSDTSVLLDLERGSLLTAAFRLSCEFAVPDLLFERELNSPWWNPRVAPRAVRRPPDKA